MSKLLDRLDHIARGAPRALGFATSTSRERVPPLALLARVSTPQRDIVAALSDAQVDAVILSQGKLGLKGLGREIKSLKGLTWGVAVEALELEQMEAYKAQGSDFVVFGIEGTYADALEEGDTARVLRVTADLEESTLRGLEDLPVDVVLLQRPGDEGPLKLTHLLAISNVRAAITRYLLLEWDGDLTPRDLEHLRDLGIDGIVLDAAKADAQAFKTVRQRIDALSRRKPKGEQRPLALLPTAGRMTGGPGRHEEEEGDEEEEEP